MSYYNVLKRKIQGLYYRFNYRLYCGLTITLFNLKDFGSFTIKFQKHDYVLPTCKEQFKYDIKRVFSKKNSLDADEVVKGLIDQDEEFLAS